MYDPQLARRFVAETIGTFLLMVVVVGSGIMGDRLSNGTAGLALIANSVATGAGLIVLTLGFTRFSGAHFNPLVTIAEYLHGRMSKPAVALYFLAQLLGAFGGVLAAHAMFGEVYLQFSEHVRAGWPGILSEFFATFGFFAVIRGTSLQQPSALPFAIGLYIMASYWFTSSVSFANPVVTFARAFTPTFAGVRPTDFPGFAIAQVCGAVTAEFVFEWLELGRPRRKPQ